jgi:hypothetical protein
VEEKFLYHIWDAGHLSSDLRTVSGKPLRIQYQGQFNTFRGPDFVNTIINLDGEDLRGAVEIHLNTQDWLKHCHHEDQFYNQVVLHVVLNHNGVGKHTVKENGELSEILELKDQLSEDIQKLIGDIRQTHVQSGDAYCELLSAIDNDRLFAILSLYGRQRFMGKVRRFNAALSLSDFDQILYEGMMEAAGYDKNKFNMLQLAQSITFANLKEWMNGSLDSLGMTGILSGASGLIAKSKNRLSEALYQSLLQAYELQPFYARKLSIDWQLFRIRPGNHPLLRLILLSEFLYSCLKEGLLSRFLSDVEYAFPKPELRYKRFKLLFSNITNDSLLHSKGLGRTVINNIYLNIYLPIMYLYAQKLSDTAMTQSVMESWDTFAALEENYITRFMCRHINPSQISAVNKRALYQQGLIDLFYRTCRYHLCEQCKEQSLNNA